MSLFQVLIIAGFIPVVVTWLLRFFSTNGLENEGSIRMPRGLLLIGIFCGLFCLVLTICSVLLKLGIMWHIILISSALLTFICILAYCSINVRSDSETFECTIFFFRRKYRYSDIRGIIPGANESYTLVMTNGKVHVDGMAVGGQQFLYYADKRCCEIGLGTIPEIHNKIFHGNVVEPLPKIILVCFPGICLIVLSVLCLAEWSFLRIPGNLQEEKMVLSFSGEQGDFLYFTSKGRNLRIDVNAVGNYNELELAISQNRQLNIIYSQSDEETLEIWGISDNSATYASPEIVYDVEVKSGREGVLICWVITLCYWIFVAFFFYILEHAEKYPWIAMLLVKKDNLNI